VRAPHAAWPRSGNVECVRGPHDVLAPFSLAFAPARERERRAAPYCEERAVAQALQIITTDRRARPAGVSSELGRHRSSFGIRVLRSWEANSQMYREMGGYYEFVTGE
jgi:hypothetical protein